VAIAGTSSSDCHAPRGTADAPYQARGLTGWFTEGFETRDLKEAKALLEELEQTGS
jgi:hypothetical protein